MQTSSQIYFVLSIVSFLEQSCLQWNLNLRTQFIWQGWLKLKTIFPVKIMKIPIMHFESPKAPLNYIFHNKKGFYSPNAHQPRNENKKCVFLYNGVLFRHKGQTWDKRMQFETILVSIINQTICVNIILSHSLRIWTDK